MPRTATLLLALATLCSPAAVSLAQDTNSAGANSTQPPALIVRTPGSYGNNGTVAPHDQNMPPLVGPSNPVPGVYLRTSQGSEVQTSSSAGRSDIHVNRGIANIDVHDPDPKVLLLVDLPGGQTQILQNGLYTFNADTNTVHVLLGEADAFPGQSNTPVKAKDNEQVVFTGDHAQITQVDPTQARVDLLPGFARGAPAGAAGYNSGSNYAPNGDGSYGYPPYPYYPGYPYYAYAPYGYGYPWGFGVGIGIGWYGGWGYRGGWGYHGGWHH
jgi:hypothetical protein